MEWKTPSPAQFLDLRRRGPPHFVGLGFATVTSVVGTEVTVGTAAAEVEVAVCVETSGAKVAAPDTLVVVVAAVLDSDGDGEGEEPLPDPELAPVQTAGPGILYSVKAWYRLKTMPGSE